MELSPIEAVCSTATRRSFFDRCLVVGPPFLNFFDLPADFLITEIIFYA